MVAEASRFSCMKFLGVYGVFDYAGPDLNILGGLCLGCGTVFEHDESGVKHLRIH